LSTAEYRTAAHHLLQQANTEFQLGDLRQASEKAWGAAAQITKAYAESLTPPTYHRSHSSLKRIARGLAQSTGNQDFLALFNAVEQLHVNFYENTRSVAAVQAGIQDATEYVALAEAELPATT
jgi:hypothetical protein